MIIVYRDRAESRADVVEARIEKQFTIRRQLGLWGGGLIRKRPSRATGPMPAPPPHPRP
jgi:hypothetical protein